MNGLEEQITARFAAGRRRAGERGRHERLHTRSTHGLEHNPPNLPDARAAIEDVTSDAHRASDIISSINATLRGVPPVAPVSIGKIVSEALEFRRIELHTNDVAVELEIASGNRH